MTLLDKIINESDVFTRMVSIDYEEMKNTTVKDLNDMFNNINSIPSQNIVSRVNGLYEDIVYNNRYPDDIDEIIQLIKDTDFLDSSKEKDLLVLLRFHPLFNENIIYELSVSAERDYESIKFESEMRRTIIVNDLSDLLKSTYNSFGIYDLYTTCLLGVLNVSKYLLSYLKSKNFDYDINRAFALACSSGNLELVEYMWTNQNEFGNIDIHHSYELPFRSAVRSKNIELVEYLWNLGIESGKRINHHIDNDYVFSEAVLSNDINITKFIWSLGGVDIHSGNDNPIFSACENGNLEMVKYLLSLAEFDLHGFSIFKTACKSGNLELVEYLVDYNSKNNGIPFKINRMNTDLTKFTPEIIDYLTRNEILF